MAVSAKTYLASNSVTDPNQGAGASAQAAFSPDAGPAAASSGEAAPKQAPSEQASRNRPVLRGAYPGLQPGAEQLNIASPKTLIAIGGMLLVASAALWLSSHFIADNSIAIVDSLLCVVSAISVFPFIAPALGPVRGVCAPIAVLMAASAALVGYLLGTPGEVPAGAAAALAGATLIVQSYRERRREPGSLREPLGLLTDAGSVPRPVERASHVALLPGDVVAADMVLERGSVAVLERRVGPVPEFRVRDEGEVLFAGSKVLGGKGEGTTIASTNDSILPRLEALARPVMFDQESLSAARRRQSEERFVLFVALCSVALAFLMSEYTASAALILYGAALLLFIGVVPGTLDLVAALERSLIVHWARLGLISRSNGVLERLRGVAAVYIDPVVSEDPGVISVVSLELLDDRIGRAALCATLSSIVGRGEDELFTALATFCQRQAGEVLPDRVIELREYEGQGMCGAIRGVEFSIGSEEFLMDRGIMLQPSDALAAQANQRVLYAAIDDDVVARFRLRSGRSDLVAPAIWPSRIVTVSTYDQTAPVSNSSLVIRAELTPAPQGVDPVSVVLFDGERFEFPAADFVMLSPDVAVLPAVIETTHAVRRTERVLDAVVYSLGALGIVAVFFGFGSALLAALLWVAATWLTARQVKAVARLSVPIGN